VKIIEKTKRTSSIEIVFCGIKSYTTRNQSIGKQKQLIEIRTKTTQRKKQSI